MEDNKIKTINPIPACCGSCRYLGTMSGAFCSRLLDKTYAMGICQLYEIRDEYNTERNNMHIYRVTIESEKPNKYCDVWVMEAIRPSAAIRKVLDRTEHNSVEKVRVVCELLVKNTTYKRYRETNPPL